MLTRLLYTLAACAVLPAVSRADVPLPTGGTLRQVDFERHVMGLLSKAGCNAGSCHGSFQGKNGFRLSLFGYEPAMDHAALTRDNLGRRVNLLKPDESLLLMKAVGAMPHDGGMRFGKDSWVYNVFREWVRGGAKWTPGSGAITKLSLTPGDFAVLKNDQSLQVKVTATFADGSTEDITPFCDFRITDDAIAGLSPLGQLTARQPGDAGLTVQYRGSVQAIRVLVPAPAKAGYPKVPEVNHIDKEVFAKLRLLNMVPSNVASDEVFIRRITIDTTAQLPTPEEVRAFVADKDPKKREKLIDKLLEHPLHAGLWATKFSDITGNNTAALETAQIQTKLKRSQMWHDWLRKRFADNVPYDTMVRDILTATSLDGMKPEEWFEFAKKIDEQAEKGFTTDYPKKKTLDLFWRRAQQVPTEQWGEKVAAAFLGVRLECAQCHKHPTDRWTQDEYWAFANLFSQVNFPANQYSSPELKKLVDVENAARRDAAQGKNANQVVQVRELFVAPTAGKGRPNPTSNRVPTPKALGGPEIPLRAGEDPRMKLADWITAPENPFFARSFVNRVWAHYFGIGLVHPVDDFSLANPPSNARLLDALAADFVKSGYDIRKLERSILVSRTYQLGYETTDSNKFDKNNYSHAYIRPLMAEQVVDVLNAALGVDEKYATQENIPEGTKIVEVGSSQMLDPNLAYALRIFGRPPRTTACDCERAMEPALPQSLFRMTDPGVMAKFTAPNGRVAKLAKSKLTNDELVDEMFLATLTRLPSADEKATALKHLTSAKTRGEAVTDLMWALVNTREFILNH